MESLLYLVLAGLATGAIYALVAIGFTLLWQTSQTINFAQGEFVMLPAFFMLTAMNLKLPFWAAILVGALVSVLLLGLAFKRLLVDPMLRHGVLPLAIATMALAIFLKESVKEFYSAEAQRFPSLFPEAKMEVGGAMVSLQSLGVFLVAIAAVVVLQLFLSRTRTGRSMQAVAQNPTVARILGVRVERMILLTFVINAVIAAIVGGFNQIRGAIAGGFLLGIVDNIAAAYVSTQYRAAIPLVILILVIMVRPQGLFGRAEERTV